MGGRPDNVDLCTQKAKREKMKESGEGSKQDKSGEKVRTGCPKKKVSVFQTLTEEILSFATIR